MDHSLVVSVHVNVHVNVDVNVDVNEFAVKISINKKMLSNSVDDDI